MRSGGFIGKKQARSEPPKRTSPPTGTDMTQLLQSSQKNPDKLFTFVWTSPTQSNCHYTVSVINSTAASRADRRGWTTSAIDLSALGDAEWKLHQELDGRTTEIFAMRSSDALLIQTLMEESLGMAQAAPAAASPDMTPQPAQSSVFEDQPAFGQSSGFASGPAQSEQPSPPEAQAKPKLPYEEGNLRTTSIRSLIELINQNKTTGRLICDIGTTQAELFFSQGDPIHAKSCHSIYQDRDQTGDAVLVDLLTWREGTFKFNQDWPAASKSITKPLEMFLAGQVVPEAQPAPAPAPSPAPAPAAKPAPAPAAKAAPPVPSAPAAPSAPYTPGTVPLTPEDNFDTVDEQIAQTYNDLVLPNGCIRFGLFLMLARSEFVRFDTAQIPFCVAAIGLELANRPLTDEMLKAIVECFDPVCQPLDIIAYASRTRLYALFAHSNLATATVTLKHFANNIMSTSIAYDVHGSSIRFSAGLTEVPADGTDFSQVFESAIALRRQATAERKVVTVR